MCICAYVHIYLYIHINIHLYIRKYVYILNIYILEKWAYDMSRHKRHIQIALKHRKTVQLHDS